VADRGAEHRPLNGSGAAPHARASRWRRASDALLRLAEWLRAYFRDNDPTFWIAFTPALVLGAMLFVRSPASNYIFDEQEALLANPYVNGRAAFLDAFKRDFWGLPPDRSIGSYRPVPNLIWRALWKISEAPWLHHWTNVVIHAANAALVAGIALRVTRQRRLAWLAGACFLTSAVLTEAISGVVGIADVLGGLGILLAAAALALPCWLMPFAVFVAMLLGLFSKESVIVGVPLLAWVALVSAPALHPSRPLRGLRTLLALTAAIGALVFYTEFRRRYFPVTLSDELRTVLPASEPLPRRLLHAFLRWFQQPRLPQDPINNPLSDADFPNRVAGALRVYWRGLGQVVFPWKLSGDYSYPQEPTPERLVFSESICGGLALLCPPILAIVYWAKALQLEWRARRRARLDPSLAGPPPVLRYPETVTWLAGVVAQRLAIGNSILLALALMWVPIAYFPHSNIPVLLPTVRAERFWYLPVIGAALLLAQFFVWLGPGLRTRRGLIACGFISAFLGFQACQARLHALDYTDDLSFWRATRIAAPNSAKAQLNYSVMVGARGRLTERLEFSKRAKDLAPRWPMAHVYYADTLCRLRRAEEAWPHYRRGFELAPNDPNLIALGLQCLWDEKAIQKRRDELGKLAELHPGSWLAYLCSDMLHNGSKHGGVEKKYRPRGYDEGPKND